MAAYFLISLLITTFGAVAGLGGGVILKPVLDAIGTYSPENTGLLSSATVLVMASVTFFRLTQRGFRCQPLTILLASGSVLGGVLGKELGSVLFRYFDNHAYALSLQSTLLALLLILVLLRHRFTPWQIKNTALIVVLGGLLGTTAAFLGIGGGPVNVAALIIFLGMDSKTAAANSLIVILLSQSSKLGWLAATEGFAPYELNMLVAMIPGAVLGGLLGSRLYSKLTATVIDRMFDCVLAGLILLNLSNALAGLDFI